MRGLSLDDALVQNWQDNTTPPQRPWVGLTEDQIKAMDTGTISNSSFYAGALWADAKLKEMNI
jgi:hypothetical protein